MSRLSLDDLRHRIVQAPMAGGPSTPALAAAVSRAGGLGFLAAGYKTVDQVERELAEVRSLVPAGMPYGLNLFAPPGHGTGAAGIGSYADTLRDEAQERGVALGDPRWDDDGYSEKLDLLGEQPVPVVSLTFGCPTPSQVNQLQMSGAAVWVTVTTVGEARAAQGAGADALVVQGVEAGGHRGGFDDAHPGDIGLLALLQLVQAAVNDDLPLVAAGGLITGRSIAAVLAGGAAAAQLGTAFMLCPEAGTVPAHRDVIRHGDAPTALTRAFTGRTARGIINRFLQDHSDAPSAYPEIHHLTPRYVRQHELEAILTASTSGLARPTRWPNPYRRLTSSSDSLPEARKALELATHKTSGQPVPITGPLDRFGVNSARRGIWRPLTLSGSTWVSGPVHAAAGSLLGSWSGSGQVGSQATARADHDPPSTFHGPSLSRGRGCGSGAPAG